MSSIKFDETIALSSLTVLEAAELSQLLEEKWGVSALQATPADIASSADLSPAEWVVADLIVLKTEAEALAKSLDETRAYVHARCQQIMAT